MNSVLVRLFVVMIGASPLLRAADQNPAASLKLSVKHEGGKVKVRFPTTMGQSYQISASRDARQWELWSDPIVGKGDVLSFDFNPSDEPTAFFRVEIINPLMLKISPAQSNVVKVTFATNAGRKYLLFSSTDLQQWQASGEPIESVGNTITFEGKPEQYYKVEEIQATPVPEMVWLKAGTFTLGSSLEEIGRDLDEDPLTIVTLTHGFWMGKYEVSQKEYQAVMGKNPSWFTDDSARPVEQVSWADAMAYCAKLTEIERTAGRLSFKYAYRLPTEAEFEYAARAGAKTRFSHGDDPDYTELGKYCWYDANSGGMTHPVGQKLPNAFGLYDVQGNTWEWCMDWYRDRYPGGKVVDPLGPSSGSGRVFRGGGWDYNDASCRPAFRNHAGPTRQFRYVGFRLVLAPELPN